MIVGPTFVIPRDRRRSCRGFLILTRSPASPTPAVRRPRLVRLLPAQRAQPRLRLSREGGHRALSLPGSHPGSLASPKIGSRPRSRGRSRGAPGARRQARRLHRHVSGTMAELVAVRLAQPRPADGAGENPAADPAPARPHRGPPRQGRTRPHTLPVNPPSKSLVFHISGQELCYKPVDSLPEVAANSVAA
jgi:hypothetical protein